MQIDIKTVNRKISVRLRQIVCLSGMAEYIYTIWMATSKVGIQKI